MLPASILMLFFASALISFGFPFFKDKIFQQTALKFDLADAKKFGFFIIPYLLLFLLQQYFLQQGLYNAAWFLIAAILPFFIKRTELPPRLCGILLLIISVAASLLMSSTLLPGFLLSSMVGLFVWKAVESLFFDDIFFLDDILLPIIWLAGDYWITMGYSAYPAIQTQGLLLGGLSVALVLRLLQGPFMFDDKIYLKRIMLSLSGGLLMLIVVNKLLVNPNMTLYAVLIGVGLFACYLFEAMEKGQPATEPLNTEGCVALLIMIGLFTLLASRLFGMLGLLVLAPTTLVALRPRATMFAGLYWTIRVLLQSYIQQYNSNVTGINLMHSYVGAALYGGLLAVLLVAIFISQARHKWLSTTGFLSLGLLLPLCSNYFLHEEPTGSFLISALMASIIVAMLSSVLFRASSQTIGAVILLPAQMISIGLLGGELINIGNTATTNLRLIVLSGVILVLVASFITMWKIAAKRDLVKVSGN